MVMLSGQNPAAGDLTDGRGGRGKRTVAEPPSFDALALPGLLGTPFAGWSKAKAALDKAILDARTEATSAGTSPVHPGAFTTCAAHLPPACNV
jgi:hypothetical protein